MKFPVKELVTNTKLKSREDISYTENRITPVNM